MSVIQSIGTSTKLYGYVTFLVLILLIHRPKYISYPVQVIVWVNLWQIGYELYLIQLPPY